MTDILGNPFAFAEHAELPTLTRLHTRFGHWEYALRPVYQDATSVPQAITPNDPMFSQQWHLNGANGINVPTAWDDYRGAGITIGFVDDGIQYTHPDLSAHYNGAIDYDLQSNTDDGAPRTSNDKHGTTTSGVAGAAGNNGQGVTGVAYEATEANFRMPFDGTDVTDSQFASLYDKQVAAGVDVSNNSWGFSAFFEDDFTHTMPLFGAALQHAAQNGRGGLGLNIVVAAGNNRADGQNTNYHSFDNSPYAIVVAATGTDGKLATSGGTAFSTPGASILVSAPGAGIVSTDRTGSDGYVNGDYVTGLAGTSYSAPIVSGVVALMLNANPTLGYRDVQEILAYSARENDAANTGWKINGATNWNGGGMHFSHDYGFGLVDATAAVRLAESWTAQSTFATLDEVNGGMHLVNTAIPDNKTAGISNSIAVASNVSIDHVEVDVNLTHAQIGDLIIRLTSPSGMVSTLVNRPGVTGAFGASGPTSADNGAIHFTFTTNADWGETGNGNWTLNVSDNRSGSTGTLTDWSLRLYGDDRTQDDTYVYTNEYAAMRSANAARGALSDAGGNDTLNLAAVTSGTTLSLVAGASSTIAGAAFTIAAGTQIENTILGDGNDSVNGNAADNQILGMRGDDTIAGGAGNDRLDGGAGTDTALFSHAYSAYNYSVDGATLTLTDTSLSSSDGTDTLLHFEKLQFADGLYNFDGSSITAPPPNLAPDAVNDSASVNQNSSVTIAVLANDTDPEHDTLTVSFIANAPGHGNAAINANNTITYTPFSGYSGADSFDYQISDGHGNHDSATVTLTISSAPAIGHSYTGSKNADSIIGGDGNDTMDGGRGNDTLDGGAGNDNIKGDYDNDLLRGGLGNDTLDGEKNNNTLIGGAGADTLISAGGSADVFVYEHLSDAGDMIQGFKHGEDKLNLHALMLDIGYSGSNPASDGHMGFAVAPGNDLQVYIDADGAGGNPPLLLLTLDNVKGLTTLTLGTDYVI